MTCLAEKIESIIAKIEGCVMPDSGDRDVLISAAEEIRILNKSVIGSDVITLQKLKSYRHNLVMSTMDQIIVDEAIDELVRLTRKIRLLERRINSGE